MANVSPWQSIRGLSVLSDNILPDGGNVAFRFEVSNSGANWAAFVIDNVAISGTQIPELTSFVLCIAMATSLA
jgi:hypothetical protein